MTYKGVKDEIPSALPHDYDRQTDFSDFEANNPGTNFSGADLDAEFNEIERALDETQDRLTIIQNEDGSLKNASVGTDQLKPEVTYGLLGLNSGIETWQTATAYVVNDGVQNDNKLYRCVVAHTSGVFADDLSAGRWVLIIDVKQSMQDAITGAVEKTTPADNDLFGFLDSAASFVLKKFTWANIKATLLTYFTTLFTRRVGSIQNLRDSGVTTNIYVQYHTTAGDGGGGRFRYVSGSPAGTYIDNGGTIIVPTGGDGSAAWLREFTGWVNVKWFGAMTSATIQSAINVVAALGGGTVFAPAGEYLFSSALSWSASKIKLLGEGIGRTIFKKTGSMHFIDIGSLSLRVTTEGNTLASNANAGATSLVLTAGKGANFTADTWVVLKSNATAVGGASVTNTAAEFVFIESIAGDTLHLASPIKFSHTTANSAEVQRVNFVENTEISDISFDGDFQTAGSVNNDNGIVAIWCRNLRINNVEGYDLPNFFVGIMGGLNCTVKGLRARDLLSDGVGGASGNFGYGLVELDLNEGLVATNMHCERVRHAYTTAGGFSLGFGIPMGSRISDGVASQCRGAGWDTHPEGLDITFTNCVTIGSLGLGFQARSVRTKLIGCSARDCVASAIYVTSNASKTEIRGFNASQTNSGTWDSTDWTTLPVIRDAGSATIVDGLIKKLTDQTVNNSTTLVDDDDLLVYVEPNETMRFDAKIRYNSGTIPDFKCTFVGPLGSTVRWGPDNGGKWDASGNFVVDGEAAGGTTKAFYGSGGSRWLSLTGFIMNGTTGGDLKFQFAQETLDASNTIVQAQSSLRVFRH